MDNCITERQDICFKQGNYTPFSISWEKYDEGMQEFVPWDLSQLLQIKLTIKQTQNANMPNYREWVIGDGENPIGSNLQGDGLSITGNDNEFLNFAFDRTFWDNQVQSFGYDILFVEGGSDDEIYTMIEGTLTKKLTYGKV